MLIIKKDNYAPFHCKTIKFLDLIKDLEMFTGLKQNRVHLNYKLLDHQNIFTNEFTYFMKI
jgi:hypothetical protein